MRVIWGYLAAFASIILALLLAVTIDYFRAMGAAHQKWKDRGHG